MTKQSAPEGGRHERLDFTVVARLDPAVGPAEDAGWRRAAYVDIPTGRTGGMLSIGVTNDLARRIAEQRKKPVEGFAGRYDVTRLADFARFEELPNRDPAREALEEMQSGLQHCADRKGKSRLQRNRSADCGRRRIAPLQYGIAQSSRALTVFIFPDLRRE